MGFTVVSPFIYIRIVSQEQFFKCVGFYRKLLGLCVTAGSLS